MWRLSGPIPATLAPTSGADEGKRAAGVLGYRWRRLVIGGVNASRNTAVGRQGYGREVED
jgi:hypothetical protein